MQCQSSVPRALHTIIHNVKSKLDQVYLDYVKSTDSNKKWIDVDIIGRSLHTLERKYSVAKFRLFSGHDCFAHNFKGMNIIGPDICVFCNQTSIMNSELLFMLSMEPWAAAKKTFS